MLRVPDALSEAGLSARMILQVHDELVLECPMDEIDQTAALVQGVMENVYKLNVPLLTEARCGMSWGQMETVGG